MLNSKESPNVFLILWASEVVLGSLIGLASVNTGARIVTLVSAGLGGFFLLVFYVATNQDLQKQMVQGMGMIAIQWSSGLWVAAAATGAVGAAGILGLADSS